MNSRNDDVDGNTGYLALSEVKMKKKKEISEVIYTNHWIKKKMEISIWGWHFFFVFFRESLFIILTREEKQIQ